jgi:uncharacterized damage-inducible protein DinB
MARSTCPMCREEHWRLGRQRVLGALAAAPRRLAASIRRARGPKLRRRPAPGEWSVVEVLAHLLDVELVLGFRVRKTAAEPRSVLTAWDQERWTAGLRHRRADARHTLAAFTALRADTVALMRRLTPAQRRASGRHAEYGRIRVDQMVAHVAEHDLNHLQQIQTTLKTLARR